MRKVSFHIGLVDTVASGVKRARALLTRHKRFNYGSAAILAVLVAPFAMQAVSATFMDGGGSDPEASDAHVESPAPQVLSGTDEKSRSSTEVKSESNSSSGGSNNVEVNVNGQNIPVPENGSVHKEMKQNGSETIVDVQVDSDSSSDGSSSYQSTTVIVDEHSYSGGDEEQERGSRRNRTAR